MTNPSTSEDRLDRIEELLGNLAEKQSATQERANQVNERVDKLAAESEKWDERFFQLSRDTLNFSRNVIVTAAVVAVLAPLLREVVVALIESFKP
jgi:predicted nuclease with TOPRIM domain